MTSHLLAAAFISGLFAILLAPFSVGHSELWRTIHNALHGPLFALTAIIAFEYTSHNLPGRHHKLNRYALAFVVAVALGAAGEIAQFFFASARDAELKDVLTDAYGAIAGLCFHACWNAKPRLDLQHRRLSFLGGCLAAALVVTPIAQTSMAYAKRSAQLPELVSWTSSLGHHFLTANGTDIALEDVPSEWGIAARETALHINPGKGQRWPGIVVEEPWPDWSLYTQLAIEVINPNDSPLELTLRVDDRAHNQKDDDRFNRTLMVQPHQRVSLKIPLGEIRSAPAARKLDLSQIAQLILFQDGHKSTRSYYLCGIRLMT